MGLFSKKCAICKRELPKKHKMKNVCDLCAVQYHITMEQLKDTIALSENAKNPLTGYDRCLYGMALLKKLYPFVEAGVAKYPDGRSLEEWISHFQKRSQVFRYQVADKNNKRPYDKKVGLPSFDHWNKVYKHISSKNKSGEYKEGNCKGCWEPGDLNSAGYCYNCIRIATTVPKKETEEFALTDEAKGLSREDIVLTLINKKLEESKLPRNAPKAKQETKKLPPEGASLKEMRKKFDVTHVRWVAQPGCCTGCAMMNGNLISIGEAMMMEERKHTGCRCSWKPVYGFIGGALPQMPKDEPYTLPMPIFYEAEKFFPGYVEPEPFKPFESFVLSEDSFRKGKYSDLNPYDLFGCAVKTREEAKEQDPEWLVDVFDDVLSKGVSDYFSAKACRYKGELLLSGGDKQGALDSFRRAVEFDPNVGVKRLIKQLEKELQTFPST